MRTLSLPIKLLTEVAWPWFILALLLPLVMVILFTAKTAEAR